MLSSSYRLYRINNSLVLGEFIIGDRKSTTSTTIQKQQAFALEGECFCLREISINVNKLLALLLLHFFIRFFILHFVLDCLLLNSLLLYFSTDFINDVNKPIIFVSGAFVDHFKNTISIFVTILFHNRVFVN